MAFSSAQQWETQLKTKGCPEFTWVHPDGEYWITTKKEEADVQDAHAYLSNESYWGAGMTLSRWELACANSLCFVIKHSTTKGEQASTDKLVGFGRLVTDYCTFSYLTDVYIDKVFRGKGLSVWFMEKIMETPVVQQMRVVGLKTISAGSLYTRFGFNLANNFFSFSPPGDFGQGKMDLSKLDSA